MAIILSAIMPSFTQAEYMLVINMILLIDGPLTDQKLMELFYSIALIAAGSAIIFNEKASSDGTDIIAMIRFKGFIKETDKHAFSIITNSSDILGKGVRAVL